MFASTHQEQKLAKKIQSYRIVPNTLTECVKLEREKATAENIIALALRFEGEDQLTPLKRLELKNVSFSVENTKALVDLMTRPYCSIEEIQIENCRAHSDKLNQICEGLLQSLDLRFFELINTNIPASSHQSFRHLLEKSTNLQHFSINGCALSDVGMQKMSEGIKACGTLVSLDFRRNNFEKEGLFALLNSISSKKSLKTLRIDNLDLGSDELKHLENVFSSPNCSIRNLEISEFRVQDQCKGELIKVIKQLQRIDHLNLALYHGGYILAHGQVDLIQKFTHLQSLGFYSCNLTDQAVSDLVKGLRNSQLTCFNIARNLLTSEIIPEISTLLRNNQKLEKLLLEHNFLGSKNAGFEQFAEVIGQHQGLKYLDLSSNQINNDQFCHIFTPIKTCQSKLKQLHMKNNLIGGSEIDEIFASNSRSLSVLSLEDNKLSESNAANLVNFSKKNITILQIGVKGNQDITSELIYQLNDECRMNICINQFILPNLGQTTIMRSDSDRQELQAKNVLEEYDLHTLSLLNQSFFRLNFIRKFIMTVKDDLRHISLVKIYTHSAIESSLNSVLDHGLSLLSTLHLEEINISLVHFQKIVKECANMASLTSVKFIKMSVVAESMRQICKAFAKHKQIRELSLANNQIKNYQHLPALMKKNSSITKLDIDRNPIGSKAMMVLWMGMHLNVSIVDLVYSASHSFFDLKTIQAMQIEITKNKNIKEELLSQYDRIHRKSGCLNLSGFHLKNFESIVKYILKQDKIKTLDLQNTAINLDQLNRLIIEIGKRQMFITTLNLSRNQTCGDQMCRNLAMLFEGKSSLQTLILDETSVKSKGLVYLIKATRQNLKVRTIQARDLGLTINHETAKDLLDALKDNISLTNVDLHGNDMSLEFGADIKRELEINKVIVENIFPKLIEQELQAKKAVQAMKRNLTKQARGENSQMHGLQTSFDQSDVSGMDLNENQNLDEEQHLNLVMDHTNCFNLKLNDMKIDDMSFVTKFLKVFPQIKEIDFGGNELTKEDQQQFGEVLKWNKYLREVKSDNVNDKQYRNILNDELEKNKKIQELQDVLANQTEQSQLVLKDQGFTDISFLPKIVKDFSNLQLLDLSNNDFRVPSSLDNLEIMIHETKTVKHLVLSNCKISAKGLNIICSFLSSEEAFHIRSIDIQNNPIPDPQLKILFSLLQRNKQLLEVKYTLTDHENIQHLARYMAKKEALLKKEEGQSKKLLETLQHEFDHEAHMHHEIKLWEKIVFPVWAFKVLIHDKHEAFRFKYNTIAINNLEHKLMPGILKNLYFSSIIYYIIVFILPNFFTKNECGKAFKIELFYIYGIYSVISMIWEIYTVIKIQKTLNDKKLLKFNKWHVVELFMGIIARLDTFLDVLFVILIGHCYMDFLPYFIPSLFFAVVNIIFPFYMLIRLCNTKYSKAQVQPYMENCCFVSFIRENMLLATVLDSFCIDNSVSFRGKPVVFGKLMGFFSFSTQDLPQFIIHVIFKFVIVSKAQKKLKTEKLLVVSLVVSFLALCISIFNMIMCDQNEFDPTVLQAELDSRAEIERKEEQKKGSIRGMGIFGSGLGEELKNIIKQEKQKKLALQAEKENEGLIGKMLKGTRLTTQDNKNVQIMASSRHYLNEQGRLSNEPIRQDIPSSSRVFNNGTEKEKKYKIESPKIKSEFGDKEKTIEVNNVENHIASERKIEVKEEEAPVARVNSEDGMTAGSPMNSERIGDYKEDIQIVTTQGILKSPFNKVNKATLSRPQYLDGDTAI